MDATKLQVIIDTLESNGSIDAMVDYFTKQASWHSKQEREASDAILRHTVTRDTNKQKKEEYEALILAFQTLKEEE